MLHAYGPATDTPDHLAALVHGDTDARKAAVRHLNSAIIHQSTPWLATPQVVVHVAGLLADDRVPDWLRAELLAFLAEVVAEACHPESRAELEVMALPERDVEGEITALLAEDREDEVYEDLDLANALFARAALGCLDAVPAVLDAVQGVPGGRELAALCRRVLATSRPG
ncbi:hypothetical protein ACRAKI_23355 [Saccharothrix isguenensis]